MYDAIIIGLGPAGISAALYTVRANLKTLLIGCSDSSLKKASKIENYYGFAEAISGEYLLAQGQTQALRLGAEIAEEEVVSIEKTDYFEVMTSNGKYQGKAVLLATGQPPRKINVRGIETFEGKGVSYCTTCDGFFYKNMKVGVMGYKDYAIHEASELLAFTKDITIYTNGRELDVSQEFKEEMPRFAVNNKKIDRLEGSDFLERIFFEDGSVEKLDGIFIAYDTASSVDFARKLGILVDGSSIIVDQNQQTNLDGVFAAGDCTGGFKQVSIAVGQGALAGRKMIEYVRSIR